MFVFGLAVVVANLPDAFRYVLQENSGVDYSQFGPYLFLGTILIAGG